MKFTQKRQYQHHIQSAADLDITPFMNLMIVLVPVLLLSMVFTQTRILPIQLPEISKQVSDYTDDLAEKHLELVITPQQLTLYYPGNVLLQRFAYTSNREDTSKALSQYLQQVKATFQAQRLTINDITLRPSATVSYQQLVNIIDAVRSYPAVVGGSVVPAELFPNISFGDSQDEPLAQASVNTNHFFPDQSAL